MKHIKTSVLTLLVGLLSWGWASGAAPIHVYRNGVDYITNSFTGHFSLLHNTWINARIGYINSTDGTIQHSVFKVDFDTLIALEGTSDITIDSLVLTLVHLVSTTSTEYDTMRVARVTELAWDHDDVDWVHYDHGSSLTWATSGGDTTGDNSVRADFNSNAVGVDYDHLDTCRIVIPSPLAQDIYDNRNGSGYGSFLTHTGDDNNTDLSTQINFYGDTSSVYAPVIYVYGPSDVTYIPDPVGDIVLGSVDSSGILEGTNKPIDGTVTIFLDSFDVGIQDTDSVQVALYNNTIMGWYDTSGIVMDSVRWYKAEEWKGRDLAVSQDDVNVLRAAIRHTYDTDSLQDTLYVEKVEIGSPATGGGSGMVLAEGDGSPSSDVDTLVVDNGSLTINGSKATLSIAGVVVDSAGVSGHSSASDSAGVAATSTEADTARVAGSANITVSPDSVAEWDGEGNLRYRETLDQKITSP